MPQLRVLQIGKYYPPVRGGIETHLEMLCQGLRGRVDLEVVVANVGPQEISDVVDKVQVRRLGTLLKLAGAPICAGLRRIMRDTQADIIHIHVPHPTALLTWLMSGCRAKLVITYHSDIIRQRVLGWLIGPLLNLVYSRAAAFLVASPGLRDGSPVLKRYRQRCALVPFGLPLEAFTEENSMEMRAVLEQFPGPLILTVGRLIYYKGFEFLIRAMAQIKSPATLLIIGEGPLQESLMETAASLGISGQIHFLGNVPDTRPYYQACDVFVLPSIARSEAFGLVQLEAMACGKPVVNTQIEGSGVSYVSRHEESGLTVLPMDSEALSVALDRLTEDNALRKQFGEAGRLRAQKEFTAQKMVDRTLDVYQQVLSA